MFRASKSRGRFLPALLVLAVLTPLVFALGSARAAPTELFFSEYIEGTSNNKALEIYNGTGGPVDLAANNYAVQMCFNGSASCSLSIPLTGIVTSGDVYVLAQAAASPVILAQADQTNGSGWFNGNDAVVLRKGAAIIDVIGQLGFDPGTEWAPASRAPPTTRCGARRPSRPAIRTRPTPSTRRSSGTASPPTTSRASAPIRSWSPTRPRRSSPRRRPPGRQASPPLPT